MPAALPEFDTAESETSKLPDFGESSLPDFGDISPVQPPVAPTFESPISIGDQGPVYAPPKGPLEEPLAKPWSVPDIIRAPFKAAGGMLATGLNLASPTTWLPQSERERQAASFGDTRTPAEQAEAKMFSTEKRIYQPQGSALEPEGSDLERLISQWSTPEQLAMLPLGTSRIGAALLLAQAVPQLEDQVKDIASGKGTENEKRDRINNLFAQALLIAHGAGKGEQGPEPRMEGGETEVVTGDMPSNMRRAQVTTDRLALPPPQTEALAAPPERLALTEDTPETPAPVLGAPRPAVPAVAPPIPAPPPAAAPEKAAAPESAATTPKPAAPEKGKGLAGEVRRRLEAGEKLGGEAGGGVPIGDLIHEFGKTLYTKGMEFAQWSARMVKELGDKAKAWLQTVWTRITDLADFEIRSGPESANKPYVPVKIRGADGKVYDAQFNGYYDLREVGGGLRTSIGREISPGHWSHGGVNEGETLLTRLPSIDKWKKLEVAEKTRSPTYIPHELEAGAGIPIPRGITDTLKKTRDTIKTLARTKGVRSVMAYTKDVAGNVATVYGQRVGNNVRGQLRRTMGRGAKPNVLDENALTFVREADGDRSQLAIMRGKITTSTLAAPKWKTDALKAIDHADANWDRINPIAAQYEAATHAQIMGENAAGINTIERPGYVMHAQDVQNDFGFFSDVAGEGGAGFKHARAYDTFADSIAAGVDPKTINSVVLLTQRIARGQMLVNNRMWVEGLKTTVDPHTRKTVVTEPEIVPRGPGLPPDVRAPQDYVTEIAGGRPIAILKSYAGIFRALTEPSKFSESLGWNATLKVATTGKHVALMLDTFHLGRIAFWESIIKPLSFTDPKLPIPSYKRGVLTLDYSRAEIQRMAASGEIDPAKLPAVLAAQKDVNGLVKHGYNVAKISDMLHQEWLQQIPVTGQFNKWLFNQFQRGAMAEVGSLEVGRYRRMHPSWTDKQVYREVAKDLNTRFGNLGRQGIFKSKTAQDTARLLALAPQWNEGLIRSEIGAVTGAVKGVASSVKEGRPSFGILPRAIGAMLLGQFIANQIINYITRGKPTWENEEEGIGAKISAWVPDVVGGGPGFFLHPAGLAAEVTHLLTQKYEKKGDLREALLAFVGGRYSTLARPLMTFLTRHDVFGKLIRPENIWKETAKSAIPAPIGASAAVPAIKQAVTGEKKETFPGQYQKQVMASMGVKTDQAPSPGQRIQALAANFRKSKGITEPGEFYESAYAPLRQALQRGAVKEAKQAYDDLIKTDHKEIQIAAAMRPWTGGNVLKNGRVTPTNPKPFSGHSKYESEFLDTLTPEQQKTADAAYAERVRIFRVFQDMLE